MSHTPDHQPNPARVAAGRLNRTKRKGITPEGRERLRQTALQHQPWRFACGPKTEAGKAKVARNGKKRQIGPRSVREVRAELRAVRELLRQMRQAQAAADGCGRSKNLD
jgi:hypothetical protein